MKPLNLDNSPCSPTSSNCVIWQGPSISCINLCTGDSVSEVIYKLATELCTIMDQLDLTNLDLSCLKLAPNSPADFTELMQIIIDRICSTDTGSTIPTAFTEPCPTNCIVPIADCFKVGTQTTMLLLDYVQMIGEKVCSIVNQIDEINNSITNITNRVTILENKPEPEPYILPSIIVDCTLADGSVMAANSYKLDVVLAALVNDDTHGYCALLSSLGQPSDVFNAYTFQSTSIGNYVSTIASSPSLFNCGTPMQTEYTSWIATPQNLSDSFINLWITVSDIRKAHKTYDVVAGNTTVNVATVTSTTTCGNKDTITVSANLPVVAAGNNITVTPTTLSNITTYTIDGKEAIVAAGDNITVTSAVGPNPGDTTYTVNGAEIIVEDTSAIDMTVVKLPSTNQWQIKTAIKDTGWHYLLGFSQYDNASNVARPQARRVGNVIYFRGVIQIPMGNADNGQAGTAIEIDKPDAFRDDMFCNVLDQAYTSDPNACAIYQGGTTPTLINNGESKVHAMQIRFARGGNVLPPEVLASGTIDNSFTHGNNHLIYRGIEFSDTGVFLTGVGLPFTGPMSGGTPGCILGFNTLIATENFSLDYLDFSSKNRMFVSRVKTGEVVPLYDSQLYSTGNTDTSNAPTAGLAYQPNLVGSSKTWPFSCDAANAGQVGGFRFRLDGLMSFLAPCNNSDSTLSVCS